MDRLIRGQAEVESWTRHRWPTRLLVALVLLGLSLCLQGTSVPVWVYVRNDLDTDVQVRCDADGNHYWTKSVPPHSDGEIGRLARESVYQFIISPGSGRASYQVRASARELRLRTPAAIYLHVSATGTTIRGGTIPNAWWWHVTYWLWNCLPPLGLLCGLLWAVSRMRWPMRGPAGDQGVQQRDRADPSSGARPSKLVTPAAGGRVAPMNPRPSWSRELPTDCGGIRADPLDPTLWVKAPDPVFCRCDDVPEGCVPVHAPGHNSFTRSPDGVIRH